MIIIYTMDEWKAKLDALTLRKRQIVWTGVDEPQYVMVARPYREQNYNDFVKEEKHFDMMEGWLKEKNIKYVRPYPVQFEFWTLNDALQAKIVWT